MMSSKFTEPLLGFRKFLKLSGATCSLGIKPSLTFSTRAIQLRLLNGVQGYPIVKKIITYPISHTIWKSKTTTSRVRNKTKKEVDTDEESNEESDESSDEDEDEDEHDLKGVDSKILSVHSLRMDLVLKSALGCSRKAVEDFFYSNKIHVNGKKVLKKGIDVRIGDELDVIKGSSNLNSNCLKVDRIEIINIKKDLDEEKFKIKIKRFKSVDTDKYNAQPRIEEE